MELPENRRDTKAARLSVTSELRLRQSYGIDKYAIDNKCYSSPVPGTKQVNLWAINTRPDSPVVAVVSPVPPQALTRSVAFGCCSC
jgi:hypothetical protein